MNDRLTNAELRAAIRETEKTVGVTVGAANTDARVHLDTLRMVERNRAQALLAAAGEKEKPQEAGRACRWRNGEDKPYTRCGLHQGWFEVIAEWAERAKAAESKLAACERERDQGKENLFTAECRLLDREKQIADLKGRMEPLTRDELIEDGAARKDWLGMTVTQTLALVNQADRIRARRA